MIDPNGRGPRLLGMMGIVTAFALGFGAIKSPSPFAGQAVVTATVGVLLMATAGAILSSPKAFWFGFATVGWASVLLAAEFWIDRDLFGPFLLGAAMHRELDPQGVYQAIQRHEFGLSQYRKIVYCQIALAQGLLGGLVSIPLMRAVRPSFGKHLWDWRHFFPALGIAVLGTLLAIRFSLTIAAVIYIQAVTVALAVATLGAFVGPYRRACIFASVLGWCSISWAVLGPEWPAPDHRFRVIGASGRVYSWIYPEAVLPVRLATSPTTFGSAWRAWIFGEYHPEMLPLTFRSSSKSSIVRGWRPTFAFDRFRIVLSHATALLAMMAGLLLAALTNRPRRPGINPS